MNENFNKNVIPIVGYYGPIDSWSIQASNGNWYPSKNTITESIYKLIADAGIHVLASPMSGYTDANKEKVLRQLELAEENGLAMFVKDERMDSSQQPTDEELQEYMKAYQEHNAFAGMYLIDEPSTTKEGQLGYPYAGSGTLERNIDNYAPLAAKVNQYPGLVGYCNLEGYYGVNTPNGRDTARYVAHIEEYVEKMKPSFLSYDYYLFQIMDRKDYKADTVSGISRSFRDATDAEEYFENLVMIRSAAKKHNIPFWAFVQAGSNWNDSVTIMSPTDNSRPTKGEFKWQVNIALAFGAKGISYFPLIQPHYFALTKKADGTVDMDYKRNGLIAEDGSANCWYWYAKEMNRQIAVVDKVLMNATSKGIMIAGQDTHATQNIDTTSINGLDNELILNSYGILTSVSVVNTNTYGAVVGCFDYNDSIIFYVVNYDVTEEQMITLNFSESVMAEVTQEITISDGTEVRTFEKVGQQITLTLGAGEGALVVLKQL